MGGTTAIGILADNGRVYYYLAGDYVGLMEILNTPYYEHVERSDITCKSVEDFFWEKRFEEEDSYARYLIMKDGSMLFQLSGDSSTYKISKV